MFEIFCPPTKTAVGAWEQELPYIYMSVYMYICICIYFIYFFEGFCCSYLALTFQSLLVEGAELRSTLEQPGHAPWSV